MIARLSLIRSQPGANGLLMGLVSFCAAALFAQSSVIVAEEAKAADVLRASHLAAGFAVVTPAGDGTLALGLASQPGWTVLVAEADPGKLKAVQAAAAAAGVLGKTLFTVQAASDSLPVADFMVDLSYEVEVELELTGDTSAGLMLFATPELSLGLELSSEGRLQRVSPGMKNYKWAKDITYSSKRIALRITNRHEDVTLSYRRHCGCLANPHAGLRDRQDGRQHGRKSQRGKGCALCPWRRECFVSLVPLPNSRTIQLGLRQPISLAGDGLWNTLGEFCQKSESCSLS